jgi:hypothetical protein
VKGIGYKCGPRRDILTREERMSNKHVDSKHTTNDRKCKRQKQLANKENRMFGKINKEKNKQ